MPKVLKDIVENAKEALEIEDMDALKDIFFSFEEEEEKLAVWKCFDSKERKKIGEYMNKDGIEAMVEERNATLKQSYLSEEELEILTEYNWNNRKTALPDAPQIN